MYSEKPLKASIKLLKNVSVVMLQTVFNLNSTQWEIGYSKFTPRPFQRHSKGTWALGYSET